MKHPNIIVILCDQLRRDALGCYGDRAVKTPNIDKLAAQGVRFTHASSTNPVCVPFRFSLMTGECSHSRMVPSINWRMSPREHTLADEFNEAGRHTVYLGKWHLYGGLGPALFKRPVPRSHQGRWAEWYGFEFRNHYQDNVCFHNDDPTPIELPGFQTDAVFDLAQKRIQARPRDKSFAMVISVEAPHPPYDAPPEPQWSRWKDREMPLPLNFMHKGYVDPDAKGWGAALTEESVAETINNRRAYYAMTENIDENVGKLMASLEAQGIAEETIILFTSDHGEHGGAHSLREKQYPYEESVGVPLIVWGPGEGVPKGISYDMPTCTEDLFPTILGLAEVGSPEGLPGDDFSGMIFGQHPAPDRPGVMLEFVQELRVGVPFHGKPYRGFRSTRYKYVVLGKESEGLKPTMFFDLRADPCEMNNLIEDPRHKETIKQHHGWLLERMKETEDTVYVAAAHGHPAANAWADCQVKAQKGEKF
jgi:arylsulfatase A-like enzyme